MDQNLTARNLEDSEDEEDVELLRDILGLLIAEEAHKNRPATIPFKAYRCRCPLHSEAFVRDLELLSDTWPKAIRPAGFYWLHPTYNGNESVGTSDVDKLHYCYVCRWHFCGFSGEEKERGKLENYRKIADEYKDAKEEWIRNSFPYNAFKKSHRMDVTQKCSKCLTFFQIFCACNQNNEVEVRRHLECTVPECRGGYDDYLCPDCELKERKAAKNQEKA